METFRHHHAVYEKEPKLSFYVRSCGHFNLVPPDRERYRECVDFGTILWCMKGSGVFRQNSRETVLRPEHVWYYPPGSSHDFQPRGERFEYCWLTIAGSGAGQLFSGLEIQPGPSYAGGCPEQLFSIVEMNLEKINQTRTSRMRALAAAFQILTMISPGQHPAVHGKLAEKARSLIDAGFVDPQFNVEKTASLLGVHRGSLSRAFSAAYGIAISQYVSRCRVRHAMELLKATKIPIREVALSSGFNSHEYFSRVFLEHTGFTPAAFRAQADKGLY